MLRFIHISDTHLGPTTDYLRYERNTYQAAHNLVRHLNALPFIPDFVLHTGDVLDFPDEDAAHLAASLFAELRYPVYYVMGNHDGRALLRQYLMNQPPSDERIFYTVEHDDVQFIALDTLGAEDPQGSVTAEQLAWLTETLAASQAPAIALWVHHLPVQMGVPWYDRRMRIMNADDLFAVLKPHQARMRGIFFGHIHRAFTGYRDGIMCSAVNSSFMQFQTSPTHEAPVFDDTAPPGYAIISLTPTLTTVTHHTIQEA